MRLLGRKVLDEAMQQHAVARGPIASFVAEVEAANWRSHHDLKARYSSASIIDETTVIFNIKGNNYRLEVQVSYKVGIVLAKWFGTHAEYSKR